jgi:hypothetical protein
MKLYTKTLLLPHQQRYPRLAAGLGILYPVSCRHIPLGDYFNTLYVLNSIEKMELVNVLKFLIHIPITLRGLCYHWELSVI